MTDARIRAAHSDGRPTVANGPITLVGYDPSWPDLYDREAGVIRAALGPRALRLEHVGSTAVPGLAAKPIVDIVLGVANPADEASYVPPLEAAGFRLRVREPGWHEHRMLKRDEPAVHLHVFAAASGELERMVGFRDRLRSSDVDRDLYAHTKRDLAARHWKYVQHYADAKSSVVEDILRRVPRNV
jgi:GrpB-like predicted nucleotidyltransferase (UPF0157 family)